MKREHEDSPFDYEMPRPKSRAGVFTVNHAEIADWEKKTKLARIASIPHADEPECSSTRVTDNTELRRALKLFFSLP